MNIYFQMSYSRDEIHSPALQSSAPSPPMEGEKYQGMEAKELMCSAGSLTGLVQGFGGVKNKQTNKSKQTNQKKKNHHKTPPYKTST